MEIPKTLTAFAVDAVKNACGMSWFASADVFPLRPVPEPNVMLHSKSDLSKNVITS